MARKIPFIFLYLPCPMGTADIFLRNSLSQINRLKLDNYKIFFIPLPKKNNEKKKAMPEKSKQKLGTI